jgi:transmembrane secretion effector
VRRLAINLDALRESRDFRLLAGGQIVSGLGTQAALVAVPYQVFVLTHSAGLVGLLGAAELGPMIVVSLLGGAVADRIDRRALLLAAQAATILAAAALALITFAGHPPVVSVFVLAGLLAGGSSLQLTAQSSMIPGLVGDRLRSALAFNFGAVQLTAIIGPALGGLTIAAFGVGAAYIVDVVSCLAMVAAGLAIGPQRPTGQVGERDRIFASIGEGLRFVRSNNALLGSFVIDLVAMTFGMPRALFAVLSLTVYHAGASGAGLLYAAVAAGATLAAVTTGWLDHARRLGRIVVFAVLAWGAAIAAAGLVGSIWPAAGLLALAGAADSVSAVCRSTINQTVTPDAMRGRMSSVFGLVVTGGVRLGDVEAGGVASLTTARTSVLSGGLACIVGVGLVVLAFPSLVAYDGGEHGRLDPVSTTEIEAEAI